MTSHFGIPDLDDVELIDDHPLVRRYHGRLGGDTGPVLVEVISDRAACSRALVESHPGLLETLAVGETDAGECAVVWPLGETLADRLTEFGPMPWHRAAELVAVLCDAMHHAHAREMFHGGIDPDSVQFGPDRLPRVSGLGLARLRTEAAAIEGIPAFAVNFRFTAPEIGTTGAATRAGDVYALGAVLAAAIVGLDLVRDLDVLKAEAPSPLVEVVLRATAKDPAARFESAAALAAGVRTARDWALYADDGTDDTAEDLDVEIDLTDAATNGGRCDTAGSGRPPRVVIPPLEDDYWYSTDRNVDWEESVATVIASEVNGTPLDDSGVDLLPGLDSGDERVVITLADAERGARQTAASPTKEWRDLPELIPVTDTPTVGSEPGTAITIADAEQAVVTPAEPATEPPKPTGPPILTVETGRVEIDDPVDGDVLITGGQLIIRAEIRGTVTIDGGRAVVFAPVLGDVINGGGTVSVEAKVFGRIRGQREFTTVRPGSQV